MAVTLESFKQEVIRLLGEDIDTENPTPVAGSSTSADLLKDACHAALLALTSRYWKSSVLEVAADDEATEISLPADLIAVEAVFDAYLNTFLPKTFFQPGNSFMGSSNSWIDFPQGTIVLSNPMASGGKVFYSAHWALPSDDADALEVPTMCLPFLLFFATSYCYMRKASETGDLRQFNSKVDSGTPTMNPAKDLSDFFLKRSEVELQRLPMKQKGMS